MDASTTDAEAEYFGLAETWDEELYGKLRRDRLIAFIVAGVAALIALASILAVMALTPLKTVQPYMVLVDRTTGYTEAVRELVYNQENSLTERESVILAEITRYVIARHTYDPYDAGVRQLEIQLSTSADEFRNYVREANADTAAFGTNARRQVKIKSIVPNLANKSAQVRFSTSILGSGETRDWIATLTYDFISLDIPLQYRYLNPLGFIIRSYRVDPETLQ